MLVTNLRGPKLLTEPYPGINTTWTSSSSPCSLLLPPSHNNTWMTMNWGHGMHLHLMSQVLFFYYGTTRRNRAWDALMAILSKTTPMNEDDRQLGREKMAGVKQGLGTWCRYIFFLLCLFYYTNEYLKPAMLLSYDILELRETGRGAEVRLRKLWNGIGVFHYVG